MRLPSTVRVRRPWRSYEIVEGAVGTRDIPASILALGSFSDIDYVDHFALWADTEATPEEWARAMFGDVPNAAEYLIWRGLLGLRLDSARSPRTIAGWQVAARGDNWIRLEAASWFLSANFVVQAADGRVSLGTFLRYDKCMGRGWWSPLSAVHRRLVPRLLVNAKAKIEQGHHLDDSRRRRSYRWPCSPGERFASIFGAAGRAALTVKPPSW
jgi:hypothetical protein